MPCVPDNDIFSEFLGWYHYDSSETGLKLYENQTRVTDYADTPTASGIVPYERPHMNAPAVDSCVPADEFCHGEAVDAPYCELPYSASDWVSIFTASAGQLTVPNGQYWNVFADTNTTYSAAKCFKYGFKNVFAKKNWSGRFDYTSRNNGALTVPDEMDWCGACPVHHEDTGSDNIKYLELNAECTIMGVHTFLGAWTASAWGSSSVDRYTGVTTNTNYSTSDYVDGYDWAADALSVLNEANEDNSAILTRWIGYVTYYWNIFAEYPHVIGGSGVAYNVEWHYSGADPAYTRDIVLTVDVANGTITRSDTGTGLYTGFSKVDSYTYAGVNYSHTWSGGGYTLFEGSTISGVITAKLSKPYTADDVYNDLLSLMVQFPLNNDITYPWRTDAVTTHGPLVTYDEAPIPAHPLMSSNTDSQPYGQYTGLVLGAPHSCSGASYWDARWEHWDHCTETLTTGNDHWYILGYGGWSGTNGIPKAATQWTNLFQSSWKTVPGGRIWSDGDEVWGAKWAETMLTRPSFNFAEPCGKTRWTIGYVISSSNAGGQIIETPTGDITASIATSYFILPVNNCITERSASGQLVLNSTNAETVYVSAGSTGSIVGTTYDGIYTVTAVDGYVVTLGKCLVSASTFPEEVTYDSDTNTGYIAPLAYPYADAICGTIAIANITGSGPLTCSLATPSWLITGDRVSISEVKGTTNANGTWTVTMINNTTIALDGSPAPNAPYTGGGNVKSLFSPDPIWNSTVSRNTYGVKSWDAVTGFRDVGEYQRLLAVSASLVGTAGCLESDGVTFDYCGGCDVPVQPRVAQYLNGMSQYVTAYSCSTHSGSWGPCAPYVVAIGLPSKTYNITSSAGTGSLVYSGDIFSNGKTFYLPTVTVDSYYPTVYAIEIQQHMRDPVWVPPPCPCDYIADPEEWKCNCKWSEDDGTCTADIPYIEDVQACQKYYAHGPMVEFICKQTDIAGSPPLLPSSSYFGCLSLPDIIAGKSGNVCNYTMEGWTGNTAWILWANQVGCVCADGRWKTEYTENGVFCVDL